MHTAGIVVVNFLVSSLATTSTSFFPSIYPFSYYNSCSMHLDSSTDFLKVGIILSLATVSAAEYALCSLSMGALSSSMCRL